MSDARELMAVRPADRDTDWLKQALTCAITLEHSTIPPYLCALWSIKQAAHPIRKKILQVVVEEEMGHMALASNMLAALGGMPPIGDPGFVPSYPTALPCGIQPKHAPGLRVSLAGFTVGLFEKVFMNIEAPDFMPVVIPAEAAHAMSLAADQLGTYPSIGEFYAAIRLAFQAIGDGVAFPTANQLAVRFSDPINRVAPIANVAEALKAIDQIREQGEGTPKSPEAAMASPELAHYYQFEQVVKNHIFIQKDGHWVESPNPIPPIPSFALYPMAPIPEGGYQYLPANVSAAMQAFNDAYREMLRNLKQAWAMGGADGQAALGRAIDRMVGSNGVTGLETLADAIFQFKIGNGPDVYGPNFQV